MKKVYTILAMGCGLLIQACDKKDNQNESFGSVKLTFENTVGDEPLRLSDGQQNVYFTTPNNESYTVTRYGYYVTNIELINDKGEAYGREEFDCLVFQGFEDTYNYQFDSIPEGVYTHIQCTLGVDSIYNVSGAQAGVLDPLHGMFWDWNTGYIMAKLEGYSPQSSGVNNMISFHLGGYAAPYSVVKKVKLALPTPLEIKKDRVPLIQLRSDVNKWFAGEQPISFAQIYSIMEIGAEAAMMAERYKHHLSVKAVNN